MVRVEPGVNSRVCHRPGPASVIHNAEADSDDQSAPVGLPTQRNKRFVQMHNSPDAERRLASTAHRAKFTAPVAKASPGKGSFH
jgi:hypothetical protein